MFECAFVPLSFRTHEGRARLRVGHSYRAGVRSFRGPFLYVRRMSDAGSADLYDPRATESTHLEEAASVRSWLSRTGRGVYVEGSSLSRWQSDFDPDTLKTK